MHSTSKAWFWPFKELHFPVSMYIQPNLYFFLVTNFKYGRYGAPNYRRFRWRKILILVYFQIWEASSIELLLEIEWQNTNWKVPLHRWFKMKVPSVAHFHSFLSFDSWLERLENGSKFNKRAGRVEKCWILIIV